MVVALAAIVISSGISYAQFSNSDDFETCMNDFKDLPKELDVEWNFQQLANICDELENGRYVHIEREGKKDIIIISATVGDTVSISILGN